VNYLHSIGIVHLDLKPSNILLTADRHCVISDLSCSVLDQTVKRKETQEVPFPTYRTRNLTACFSAPELVERKAFSARADIWSLGMILFDLVCPDYLLTLLGDDATQKSTHYQMLNATDLKIQMARNRAPHSISNAILSVKSFKSDRLFKLLTHQTALRNGSDIKEGVKTHCQSHEKEKMEVCSFQTNCPRFS
jgi:serine/threonine protein kinase